MAPKKRPLSGRAKQLHEAKLARLAAEAQRQAEPESEVLKRLATPFQGDWNNAEIFRILLDNFREI